MTDVPAGPEFVNPNETASSWRFCLWAAPGQGKTVAAATAPGPIYAINADRPRSWAYARKLFPEKDIREVRYVDEGTLRTAFAYLRDDEHGKNVATIVVDPIGNIIDQLRTVAPPARDGDGIDHEWVNKKIVAFIRSLRQLDLNVVIVAHEKLNDGKKGDNKLYPAIGGGTLINKVLAEMDVVAHVERLVPEGEDVDPDEIKWVGVLQPVRNLVCKDGTGALGPVRILDIARWCQVASEFYAPTDTDLPWATVPDQQVADANPPNVSEDQEACGPGEEELDPETAAHVEAQERELDAAFEAEIAKAFPGSTVEQDAPKTKPKPRQRKASVGAAPKETPV